MLPLVLALVLGAGPAQAAERAAILRVEGPVIYTNAGRQDGLVPGQTLEGHRAVSVVDPATGRTLTDYFSVGVGVVTAAGDTLTRLQVPADVAVQLQAGDAVQLPEAAPAPAPAPAVAAAPAPSVAAAPAPAPAPAPVVAAAPAPAPTEIV